MNVLVADDEEGLADILSKMLIREGHAVDVAHDGEKALEFLKKKPYEMALLDFGLPDVTGLELLDFIKTQSLRTIVVLITGYEAIEETFLKTLGVHEYLHKPFKLREVEDLVRKYS